MSNSPLVQETYLSPNHGGLRQRKIGKYTIHHMAGVLTAKRCGEIFMNPARMASSNYGIGHDGRIAMYVEEKNHPWTSGDWLNDDEAVTVEVSNSAIGGIYPVSDYVLNRTIDLGVDVFKRNNIPRAIFTGDRTGTLTLHRMFQPTACPGEYLFSKMQYIESEINRRLQSKPALTQPPSVLYRVQVGAFGVYTNAVRLSQELKRKGYDTIIVKVGNLYKVQTGAFGVYSNATRQQANLKKAGYTDAFITDKSGTVVPIATPAPAPRITVGSIVRVKQGATDWNGTRFLDFVYATPYRVSELSSNGRAVITSNGIIVGAVSVNNLYLA